MTAGTVNIMPHGRVHRVVEIASKAERMGYSRCWMYDEGLATRDVWIGLAAAAMATDRIMLGPGITNPYTRHPGSTAGALGTLDELSGGRAFLGVGAGGGLTLGPLNIERRRPLAAVEEMIHTVRALVSGETVDFEGETVNFRKARLQVPSAKPQIWLAGRGPKMLELGGRIADGFHLSFLAKSLLGDAVATVRSGGRPVRISYSTMLVTDESLLGQARRQLSFRLPDQPLDVRKTIGVNDEKVSEIREALAAGGPDLAAALVQDEWLEHFVIMGDATDCSKELAALSREHGIDEFQVPILDLDSAEDAMQTAAEILHL